MSLPCNSVLYVGTNQNPYHEHERYVSVLDWCKGTNGEDEEHFVVQSSQFKLGKTLKN